MAITPILAVPLPNCFHIKNGSNLTSGSHDNQFGALGLESLHYFIFVLEATNIKPGSNPNNGSKYIPILYIKNCIKSSSSSSQDIFLFSDAA